jgi:hypothetical protein
VIKEEIVVACFKIPNILLKRQTETRMPIREGINELTALCLMYVRVNDE